MKTTDGTKNTRTVVAVRHPQKDGDAITPLGAQQAFAAAQALSQRYGEFAGILHSGANRTKQAATVMGAALGQYGMFGSRTALHFKTTLEATLGTVEAFTAEVAALKAANGGATPSLAFALERSKYASDGREVVAEAIIRAASEIKDGQTIIVVSHSPWVELAMLDPMTAPYGVGEADAVAYVVKYDAARGNGRIISSEMIAAPLPGAKNT